MMIVFVRQAPRRRAFSAILCCWTEPARAAVALSARGMPSISTFSPFSIADFAFSRKSLVVRVVRRHAVWVRPPPTERRPRESQSAGAVWPGGEQWCVQVDALAFSIGPNRGPRLEPGVGRPPAQVPRTCWSEPLPIVTARTCSRDEERKKLTTVLGLSPGSALPRPAPGPAWRCPTGQVFSGKPRHHDAVRFVMRGRRGSRTPSAPRQRGEPMTSAGRSLSWPSVREPVYRRGPAFS